MNCKQKLRQVEIDNELLLDYITYLELKYLGKIVNGRLPLFDDDDR